MPLTTRTEPPQARKNTNRAIPSIPPPKNPQAILAVGDWVITDPRCRPKGYGKQKLQVQQIVKTQSAGKDMPKLTVNEVLLSNGAWYRFAEVTRV